MAKKGRKSLYASGFTMEVKVPAILEERFKAEAQSMDMTPNTFLYCLISASLASPGPTLYTVDKLTSVNPETLTEKLRDSFRDKRTNRPPLGTASLAHRIVGSYVRQSRFIDDP